MNINTLENAIKLAKATIVVDEEYIYITKSKINNCDNNQYRNEFIQYNHNNTMLDDNKGNHLMNDNKSTESLHNDLKHIIEKYETLRKYTKLLEQKQELVSNHELIQSNNIKEICDIYELMTSMKIIKNENENKQYDCIINNKVDETNMKFQIKLTHDNYTNIKDNIIIDTNHQDMYYKPHINNNLLPEYLQYELFCNHQMAPVIISDILQSLYQDKEDIESS